MNDPEDTFISPDDIVDDDGGFETELLDDDDIRVLTYLENENNETELDSSDPQAGCQR